MMESEYDEEEERDMKELEEEAKMLRDEKQDEGESDEQTDKEESDEGENAEFLAGGEDLDLPSEISESDGDLKGPDDTDSELENYYEEIGIADEEDFSKPKEPVYQTKQKAPKAKAEPEKSKKSMMIDQLINAAKTEPTYKNVSRIIKLVK